MVPKHSGLTLTAALGDRSRYRPKALLGLPGAGNADMVLQVRIVDDAVLVLIKWLSGWI